MNLGSIDIRLFLYMYDGNKRSLPDSEKMCFLIKDNEQKKQPFYLENNKLWVGSSYECHDSSDETYPLEYGDKWFYWSELEKGIKNGLWNKGPDFELKDK